MGAKAAPWTQAMADLLADGDWHPTSEVLAVGAAVVPDERALKEMGSKKAAAPGAERLNIGRRNVSLQGLTSLVRFGKAQYGDGRTTVRHVGDKSFAIGDFIELCSKVDAMQALLEKLQDQLDSQQAQLDRLDSDDTSDDASEDFLRAAGVIAPAS